jgi:sulfur-carrier protein
MATVILATTLSKWLPDHVALGGGELRLQVPGDSVRQVLDGVFAQRPQLRSYVLEDHGGLRHHVAVFVDGAAVRDKQTLQQPVSADAELFIAQALSGG